MDSVEVANLTNKDSVELGFGSDPQTFHPPSVHFFPMLDYSLFGTHSVYKLEEISVTTNVSYERLCRN